MEQLPDFWRTEIWHPLSVHFPIALLTFGTLFMLVGLYRKSLSPLGNILIWIGTVGAWISVFTGSMADGVVTRELCDPTVLEAHENGAYTVAWLFTITSALTIAEYFGGLKKLKRATKLASIILAITGSGFLAYTGHLGATLVYQQAAGVYTPSEDCSEFVD